ncbi:MAG: hypothetical protein HY922_14175, partial [Elusimicrobia bacterium]|nr:hypothetical protein [Elusimicrobiota bacterium]
MTKTSQCLSDILRVILALSLAWANSAWAAAPNTLTYQGRLKESGLPFTGVKSVEIKLCTAQTAGICQGAGAQNVYVSTGLFRTTFTVPSAVDLTSGVWYLELSVGGVTLSPREMLTSSPYAVFASTAGTVLAGSIDSGKLAGGAVDSSKLASDYNSLALVTGGLLRIPAGDTGKLGIGTTQPATKLDVAGNAQFGSGAARSTFSATGALAFPAAYSPVAPQEAATKAYVDGQVVGGGSGWLKDGTVVRLTSALDNVVVQSTLSVQGGGASLYSIGTSSGINVGGTGGVYAAFLSGIHVGDGSGLANVSGTDATKVLKAGDAMTGQLTIRSAGVNVSSISALGALGVGGIGLSAGTLVVKSTSTDAANPVVNIQNNAGAELMRVQQDGNVGIGATSPAYKLDVNGGGAILRSSSMTLTGMAAPVLSLAGQGAIYFDAAANRFKASENGGGYSDLVVAAGSVDSEKLAPNAVTNAKLAANAVDSGKLAPNSVYTAAIQNNAVTNAKIAGGAVDSAKLANDYTSLARVTGGLMTIPAADTGKVGIGTASPEKTLHVAGDLLLPNVNSVFMKDSVGSAHRILTLNNDNWLWLTSNSGEIRIADSVGSTPLMTLMTVGALAGRVGIGTINPAAKLDVQGTGGINVQYGLSAATASLSG